MEENETFRVELSSPVESTISDGSATITLDNDDSEYQFNTLPIYGKVEYLDNGTWVDVIENNGYERDAQFRYNPTELEVLAVSKDVSIGSFDEDPSNPNKLDGVHGLSEWGTISETTSTFIEDGVTITTELASGTLSFNPTFIGLGSAGSGNEISSPNNFTITLNGDFLNDVKLTAGSLGGCFDVGVNCETKVSIDAYDENNNLLSSQGGYRQSGLLLDSYYFTGETPIKKFVVYPTPTNIGGLNIDLRSGNFVLSNITISRTAFEVIDYKFTDVDGTISTERINLNINEGNANTNVDLNQYLLNQ